MPISKLKAFLDAQNVKYQTIYHSPAYTAQEIASRAHVPGKQMAKTVVLKIDGELALAVLPASEHVDTFALKNAVEAESVRLATEFEFKDRFPDCEVGAMPPFGNLYGLPVFVDQSLTEDDEIAFSAGSHRELMRLAYADFSHLVQPRVAHFLTRKLKMVAGAEDRGW